MTAAFERFNVKDSKTVNAPIVDKLTGEAHIRALDEEEHGIYQEITGCLIYFATNNRYDIGCSVMALSQRMNGAIHKTCKPRSEF